MDESIGKILIKFRPIVELTLHHIRYTSSGQSDSVALGCSSFITQIQLHHPCRVVLAAQ